MNRQTEIKDIDTDQIPLDALGKAILAAFKYHPFGVNRLGFSEKWVYGPTFAVMVPEENAALFQIVSDTKYTKEIYIDNPVAGMTELKRRTKQVPVTVDTKGHSKLQAQKKNKHGATISTGPNKCSARYIGGQKELALPLARLASKVKVAKWEMGPSGLDREDLNLLYGLDENDELVMIAMPRNFMGCTPEWRELPSADRD